MIGPSASGKSTFAKYFSDFSNIPILSFNEVRKEFTGDENDLSKDKDILRFVKVELFNLLKKGNLIFDAANCTVKSRKFFAASKSFKKCGIFLNTPLETCKIRNQERKRPVPEKAIEYMHYMFVEPDSGPFLKIQSCDKDGFSSNGKRWTFSDLQKHVENF